MARIIACAVLLALTTSVRAQFFADLFQGYQPFLASPTFQQIYDDTTRRIKTEQTKNYNRGTTKYEQTGKNEDRKNNILVPISSIERDEPTEVRRRKTTARSIYSTTVKPRKIYSGRRVISTPNRRDETTQVENGNEYDGKINYINDYYAQKPSYDNSNYESNNRGTNYDRNNYYTTNNPLIRPGVRPAVVDSRPPITNRPVDRPNYGANPSHNDDDDAISFPGGGDSPQVTMGPDEDSMSQVEKKRYIELAERMCDKYKALTTKAVQAIPLLPSPEPVRVNVSGCAPVNVPLVVGGRVVKINEFPHMALLGWRKLESAGYSWKCGGSLLSEQFVLTAAHCSYQDRDNTVVDGPPRAVQLGSSYLNDPGALVVKVSSVIRHPKYKAPKSYYDLALVKLATTVKFSEMIKPACLGVPPSPGQSIIATGWGRTEYGGDQSHELRSVSLPIWGMRKCREVLGTSRKLPDGPSSDSQICAGEERGGKDTCQGDSGGPAQLQDGCIWRVVAVTSLGRSCGAAETPGVYAIAHRAFIASQIVGNQNSGNTGSYDTNNRRPGASDVNYDTNNRRPGASSVDYDTNNRRPGASDVNYDTNNRRPGASSVDYDTNNRRPGASDVNYDTNNRRPGASSVDYDTNNRRPGASDVNYDTNNRRPGASGVNYDTNNRRPGGNVGYDSNNRRPEASNVDYDNNNRQQDGYTTQRNNANYDNGQNYNRPNDNGNYKPDNQVYSTQRPDRNTADYGTDNQQNYNTQRPNYESSTYATQRPNRNENDGIVFNYENDNIRSQYTTKRPVQNNNYDAQNNNNNNRGQIKYDVNSYGNTNYGNSQGTQNNYNRRPSYTDTYTVIRPWWSK